MQRTIIITITRLALFLGGLASAWAQGTIRVTFDGPPAMPAGSTLNGGTLYSESGVGATSLGGGFSRRWSGDSVSPNNGTAYLQPAGSSDLFFNYGGSGWRFNAVSVDMALYSSSSLDPVTVRFTASGYGRTTDIFATTEFTISGAVDNQGRPLFQTFFFPPEFNGFSGMYYLSITPTAPLWSLDNLVISEVPEPSSLLLLSLGGLVLAGARARMRATQ